MWAKMIKLIMITLIKAIGSIRSITMTSFKIKISSSHPATRIVVVNMIATREVPIR